MRGETVDVADYAFETHICLIWGHNPNLCCHESKMQLQSSFDKSIVELFACKNCHDDLFLFESSAVIYQDFCLMIWIQNDRKTSSGLRVFQGAVFLLSSCKAQIESRKAWAFMKKPNHQMHTYLGYIL